MQKILADRMVSMSKFKNRLQFLAQALDEWHQLEGSAREPLKQLLNKRLEKPHMLGSVLHGEIACCNKIKLKKQGVRLSYCVENDKLYVMVMAVDEREDSSSCRGFGSIRARLMHCS